MEKNIKQISSNCIRIVLYGPESTGKTSLARDLASNYKTQWVPEFARGYLQDKWNSNKKVCTLDDLPIIVRGQMDLENRKIINAKRVIFCDTNVMVTRAWSETHFDGYCDQEILNYTKEFKYDLYLLTDIDLPWEKDDLRARPNHRKRMYDHFRKILDDEQQKYFLISGSGKKRTENAIGEIDFFLKNHFD